jgi:hypothetical protein
MIAIDDLTVVKRLEDVGINIVRGGFASWIRHDLGFQASDEHVALAMQRVRSIVAGAGPASVHDLTAAIAIEMPASAGIDAFGGSAWTME